MSSSIICMNGLCGAKKSTQWKSGWVMKAGGFATLCYSCGTVYDQVNYCERFHLNEPGWRECKFCEKPIHCGCVVSKYLHECLDLGGISCLNCVIARGTQALKPIQSHPNDLPNGFIPFSATWRPVIGNRMNGSATIDKGKLTQPEAIDKHQPTPSISSLGHQFKQDETRISSELNIGISSNKDVGTVFSNSSSLFNNGRTDLGFKSFYESKPQPSLNYSIATTKSSVDLNSSGPVEPEKVPSFKQCQRSRLSFPKPTKPGLSIRSQSNKGIASDNRVARPPAEGRGRNQLLPRYWPKITDQELLQISGELPADNTKTFILGKISSLKSNCTITPLFEKVLSASDAGRIGRLVLPKACAEAYFPDINQSEGLPIRIQDIKGGEWTFQFRFWPNNNSRMYVLEGVTPCIQNMQLQAGDTVIFSRLDPGEKLVIGCRKATVSADTQEGGTGAVNGVACGTSGGIGNVTTKNVEHDVMANGDKKTLIQEKKKSRNIGLKNKRLFMHNEDALELKVTWEEAHELIRPSPTCKPTISMIENFEIEEYDEPPVFGKKTIFTVHASGSQEQWGQCDNCFKWRRLPPDVLLPSKWTCSDNVSDPDRASCSAPDETCKKDLERIFRFGKDFKRRKLAKGKVVEEQEPSGLDALASAAALGETIGDLGEPSTSATTRHPRHRPGCTCIVCIQPPSGKGKHKPNCVCNVCLTVKRRFKTLMLRKKKKLSDREAEMAQKIMALEDGAVPSATGIEIAIGDLNGIEMEVGERNGNGGQQLDLNCDPDREDIIMFDANASGAQFECSVLTGAVTCSASKSSSEVEGPSHPPVVGKPSPSLAPLTHTRVDESLKPVHVDQAEKEMNDKVVEDQ